MFTAPSESTISTSQSLETHDTSENNAFSTTSGKQQATITAPSESTISTSQSLETNDTSENNAFSTTRPTPAESKQGYMLAIRYSDQITSGTNNLLDLMCLAKKIGGVQVVEPFITGSLLGMNVSANWTKEVRMSDIFDYEMWKHANPVQKYGVLASFKDLMQNGPRKLVMVQYCFHATFCYPCKHEDVVLKSRVFCKLNNFELVGHECFSYEKEKTISFSSIKNLLYSKYRKSEVVVMFDVFGGLVSRAYNSHKSYRFFANVTGCKLNDPGDYSALRPSQSVSSDADKFIQTYLNGVHYIAVMIRLEIVFNHANISRNDRPMIAKTCFTNILQRLEMIKKELELDHVFVTLDVGQYGSRGFRGKRNINVTRAIEHHIEDFLSTIYGRNMTIGEYEERHVRTSRKKNPGYISVVQKEIAARGDALVLVGRGSTYQSSTKQMYDELHKNKPKHVFKLYTNECKLV